MAQQPKRRGLFDVDVPFFLPVWRRIVVVAFAICWGLFELSTGAIFWGMVFVGMGSIAAWRFAIADWDAVAQAENDPQND